MSHLQTRLSAVIFGALLACTGSAVASARATFPGPGESTDPTGRWSIKWSEATSETPHRLILKNLKTHQMWPLLDIDRRVDVLWAPDGAAVVITDYAASTDATVYVYRLDRVAAPIDVEKSLIARFGRIPALYENGHRYFEAVKWMGPSKLRFGVHAHDARPGTEYRGMFDLDLRTSQVQRVKEEVTSK